MIRRKLRIIRKNIRKLNALTRINRRTRIIIRIARIIIRKKEEREEEHIKKNNKQKKQ